jgi:oligopeptidase B
LRRTAAFGVGLPIVAELLRPNGRVAARQATPQAPAARPGNDPNGLDEFAWLENPDDPAVQSYLTAENDYSAAMMAPTRDLQEALVQELMGRIHQEGQSIPTVWNGYLYYQRT